MIEKADQLEHLKQIMERLSDIRRTIFDKDYDGSIFLMGRLIENIFMHIEIIEEHKKPLD